MRLILPLRSRLAWLLLAAAVTEAVLWEGGFAAAPRLVFGAVALAALAASAIADGGAARGLIRQPVPLTLWTLAALGATSAAWTIASVGDALRWGLVTAGYGAVVVAAGVIARRRGGVEGIAAGVCALALVSGIVGLVAACVIGEPLSDWIGGHWRPGGPLEYSSALALLEVSALPGLLRAMCSRRRWLAAAGAGGAVVAGAVLGLADSRAELLFAALVGCAAIALPQRTLRSSRPRAAAATLAVVAAGVLTHLIAGGHIAPQSTPGAWRLLALGGACAGICAAWAAVTHATPAWRTRATIACAAGLALAVALGVGEVAAGAGHPARHVAHATTARGGPNGDLLHGRGQLWDAAIEAFAARPLAGAGADSFLLASARYQKAGLIRFAHDLPLELGVELGVAGLLAAIALYLAVGVALWRARRRAAAWLLGPGVVAFMAAGLIDWQWHLAGSGAVWAACIGGIAGVTLAPRNVPAKDAIDIHHRSPRPRRG